MYAKALEKPLGQRFAPLGKCYRTELLELTKQAIVRYAKSLLFLD